MQQDSLVLRVILDLQEVQVPLVIMVLQDLKVYKVPEVRMADQV